MKNLFLFLILSFFLADAAFACRNMVPLSAAELYITTPGTPGVTCEERPGDECLCFDHIEGWDIAEIQNETFDKPIYSSKVKQTSCETAMLCEAFRSSLCDKDQGELFFYAENMILSGYEAYCVTITGYEKIPTGKKILVNNPQKLQAKKTLENSKNQTEALISAGKKAREACQRVLDLIGGFNLLPGRSSEQAGQMVASFAEAKQHLQDGRPAAAKTAIQAIPVDGVLVTQAMKDLALAQLEGY
jgi:hypothetical protein